MNAEFHYYAVYALALEAGLPVDTARRLAQSSQYVDSALSGARIEAGSFALDLAVTQNYVFWDRATSALVYLPFHFLPGDPKEAAAKRADGRAHPLAVTPNGKTAKELLIGAFRDKNPWLMGIAMHAFADTWAHQNFTGTDDEYNQLADAPAGLPPVAHLQALSHPDEPDRVWTDSRLVPEHGSVNNRARFLAAAGKLYRYLCVFSGKTFADQELVLDGLAAIWASSSRQSRLADYTIRYGIEPWEAGLYRTQAGLPAEMPALSAVRHFDKLVWARAELAKALRGGQEASYALGPSFAHSELYHWNEAALEFRRRATAALSKRGLL